MEDIPNPTFDITKELQPVESTLDEYKSNIDSVLDISPPDQTPIATRTKTIHKVM